MKKLLYLISLIQLSVLAQDSTSISFDTETVQEFKRQSLMDEFDRAFGGNRKVNTRIKAGFMDLNAINLPFIGLEQRIGRRLNFNIGGMIRTSNVLGAYNFTPFQKDPKLKVSTYAELKYYLKAGTELSGNYIGLEFKDVNQTPEPYLVQWTGINILYFPKNQFSLNIGKQFGSVMDIGLQIGPKNTARTEVGPEGFLYYNPKPRNPFVIFAGTYSKIGLGKDFPLIRREKEESCEFLNCYNEFKSLFKVNMSNILYVDPYIKYANLDFSFERKLGTLPVSLDLGLMTRVGSHKRFEETGEIAVQTIETGHFSSQVFKNEYKSSTTINSTINLQFRYYPLQNRNIAGGKSVSNLSGFYTGLYSYRSLVLTNYPSPDGKLLKFSNNKDLFYNSGVIIGLQRKILKNYYYDFSINCRSKKLSHEALYSLFKQEIKFGYAF